MAKAPVKQTRHPAKAVLRPTVIVFGLGPSVDQLNNVCMRMLSRQKECKRLLTI